MVLLCKVFQVYFSLVKEHLKLVTMFSKDTGMTFIEDKCSYQQMQNRRLRKDKGILINLLKSIKIVAVLSQKTKIELQRNIIIQ